MGITVDGVELETLCSRVEKVGWADTPGVDTKNVKVAGRHGAIYTPRKAFDEGSLVLKMWADGSDPVTGAYPLSLADEQVAFQATADALRRLFTRRTGLLDVRIPQPGGGERQAFAEVDTAIGFDVSSGAGDADFAVSLIIPGVFWQDVDAIVQTFTGVHAGTDFVVTDLDGSTAPIEDAQITVTATANVPNPKVIDLASGAWVKYGAVLTAGQAITFDSSSWSVTPGGSLGAVDYGLLTHHGATRLLPMSPTDGGPRLRLDATGVASCTVSVAARRKFISA